MDVHDIWFFKTWTSTFLKLLKHGRPERLKIRTIERCRALPSVQFYCSRHRRERVIPRSFSLQIQRLREVVLLKFEVKMEYGGINFDPLQWYPPSSPQQQEGVTTPVQLPSLDDDRTKEISSILGEYPHFALSPLCLQIKMSPHLTTTL